jgi:hypothetical protein
MDPGHPFSPLVVEVDGSRSNLDAQKYLWFGRPRFRSSSLRCGWILRWNRYSCSSLFLATLVFWKIMFR